MGHFGFSYVGFVYLLMLFLPNLLWTRCLPKGYDASQENKYLVWFERIGEVLLTTCALIFSDFNLQPFSWRNLLLGISFLTMLLYEGYWVRYFRSEHTLQDFYCSFCGIPLAGATLPVIAFLFLGLYGGVIWMILFAIILGIGHIGIHLQHQQALYK